MSANEVRSLPPDCRNMREDYFKSVDLATKHPEQYEKMLVTALTQAKKVDQPYEAIFFATILHSDELVKALKVRESLEAKFKLPYVYARAALYRLSGKSCSENPAFAFSAYQEICYADDDVLPHVFYRHYPPKKRKASS